MKNDSLKEIAEVIKKAQEKKILERHLETKIEENIYDELINKI